VDVIDQASNGLEALELVKESEHKQLKQPYDIILLDLEMPILNGYQACK
jgi:CheY-like chemotaxis protein